jgi:hypothetical protein
VSERAPYSRVYWSIVDDPKFAGVYDNDRLLATWLRLLILADQSYPASPAIPLGTNVKSLDKLVEVGLVDRGTGFRFRVHGLDKERARRRPVGAGPPPIPDLNPPGPGPEPEGNRNGTRGLSQAKPSRDKDETSRDTARAPDPADVYWTLTGRYPTDKVLGWVDDLSASYGQEAVIRALATTHQADRATNTLLGRTQDVLRSEARALSLKEQATVRQDLKERRAAPVVRDEAAIRAEIQRLMEPGAAA